MRKSIFLPLFCLVGLTLGACDRQNMDMLASLTPQSKDSSSSQSSTDTLYLTLVEGLIDQGRYRAALGYLDQYAVGQPKTPHFTFLRGEALLGVDRYDDASQSFAALRDTEFEAAGYNGLGRVEATQERWAEAAAG